MSSRPHKTPYAMMLKPVLVLIVLLWISPVVAEPLNADTAEVRRMNVGAEKLDYDTEFRDYPATSRFRHRPKRVLIPLSVSQPSLDSTVFS